MAKPILYSYFISTCAWRVRIALAHKGIEYDYRGVNLQEDFQHKDEYLKINPIAQVPALVINGRTLTQSLSIIEYLEEVYPKRPLMPNDPLERAKVREICELLCSGIQPLQNLGVVKRLKNMDIKEWRHFFNRKGLQALETILKESCGKYCVGDKVTMADCCLVPQVFAASVRFGVDLEEFPLISAIYSNLTTLPTFEAAHPFQQPDAPGPKSRL